MQAFIFRTPTVAASGFSRQQILFLLNLVFITTVASVFVPGSFENTLWSSHWSCSVKKGVLRNFANFTVKHQCWSLSLIDFIKKRLQHKCFPVDLRNFLIWSLRLLLKPVLSSGLPFLITYTSDSNWYTCCSFCILIHSFVCQFSIHYYWYCYNHKQWSGGVL